MIFARPAIAICCFAAFLLLAPARVWAQGGPPLITDDPDTPGPGYWEINIAAIVDSGRTEKKLDMPRVDINYGVGQRIQLKFEVPWIGLTTNGESTEHGLGDAVAGVKWRFKGHEGTQIAWSVYPQIEFNTMHSSVTKGVVDDGSRLMLPTELTLEIAHVEINGELGRELVEHGADAWLYGISTEGHVLRRLELLGDLHVERPTGVPADVIGSIGAREKISRQVVLLLAVGHTVGAPDQAGRATGYFGLQFNFPGLYTFPKDPAPIRSRP